MEQLINLIDIKLLILIVVSSYWAKKHLKFIFPMLSLALKIFIWSTILSIIYFYVGKMLGVVSVENAIDLIITYFVATSFYELFFKPLKNWIIKITDKTDKE